MWILCVTQRSCVQLIGEGKGISLEADSTIRRALFN
jgi:hypothetical protein